MSGNDQVFYESGTAVPEVVDDPLVIDVPNDGFDSLFLSARYAGGRAGTGALGRQEAGRIARIRIAGTRTSTRSSQRARAREASTGWLLVLEHGILCHDSMGNSRLQAACELAGPESGKCF